MRAIRPLAKGTELVTNYGAFYGTCVPRTWIDHARTGFYEPTAYRRDWLKQRFKFVCQCDACAGVDTRFARLEREMQAFRCQYCMSKNNTNAPAWPANFFDPSLNDFKIKPASCVLGEPMSIVDWLDNQPAGTMSQLAVVCDVCTRTSVFNERDVQAMCNLKTDMYDLRANAHDDDVDMDKLDKLYARCERYLYAKSHDMVDLRDIYIQLVTDVDAEKARTAMCVSRRVLVECFGADTVEYQYELRAHLKLYIDMCLDNADEIQSIAREQVQCAVLFFGELACVCGGRAHTCTGKRAARHYFRLTLGSRHLPLYDAIAAEVSVIQ
jgi:hypothetical protein